MEQPVQKPRGREYSALNQSVRKKEWLELVGQELGEGGTWRDRRARSWRFLKTIGKTDLKKKHWKLLRKGMR